MEAQKIYTLEQLRLRHPNAYKSWTPEEDAELLKQRQNGLAVRELAELFGRKRGAISSRLKKLLETPEESLEQEPSGHQPVDERPKKTTVMTRLSPTPIFLLTQDQEKAREAIDAWRRSASKQVLTLGGYAGTGKTTVIAETVKRWSKRPRVAFCCYTGKAADILRDKLVKTGAIKTGDYCGTIHGLIYEAAGEDADEKGKIEICWERKDSIEADLLVVDEASMVSREIWEDLCFFGVPILAVGDHGQLPPIGGKGNLMENPDIRLETIHRQAKESPIIKLSIMAREEGKIPIGEYGPSIVKTDDDAACWRYPSLDKVMFLCGRNKTRVALNAQIRERLGLHSLEPVAGDRVICLRNARRFKVFNGMLGIVQSIKASGENFYRTKIRMDSDVVFKGRISRSQFGQERTLEYTENQGCLFDWGYALTVHKAQGSEAAQVVLFEERFSQMSEDEWRRWLYTAVTRASQELVIIGN
ncbi:MAG: AAA family ATPase [Elusimicrobia bacterium]|nr:AAA family ATPase [Elusimicrobiota bacterium]